MNLFVLCTPAAPASIVSRGPEGLEAKWTLNQVQGDETVKAAIQPSHPTQP
jgi:hypothetical protein